MLASDPARGNGRICVGSSFATVRLGVLSKGQLAAMPRQLDIDRREFSIMIYAYPCRLAPDEVGEMTATFPDVPEAITGGRDRAEALALAEDALTVALAGYIRAKQDIPAPGETACGLVPVPVPAVVAAKLALYSAMRISVAQ